MDALGLGYSVVVIEDLIRGAAPDALAQIIADMKAKGVQLPPAVLFTIAIQRISAVQADLIAVIKPVFNPIWVYFAIGEAPGRAALTGGGIIIVGVTAASIISACRKEETVGHG